MVVVRAFSVARWWFSPPDLQNSGGLKVVWPAKNISRGLPISGGFDQFCMGFFCVADLADSGVLEPLLAKGSAKYFQKR
jgi:hypothetical protein